MRKPANLVDCVRASVPLAAAVAVPSLIKGGFTPFSQSLLIVLAAVALLDAARTDAWRLIVLGRRSSLALVLLALGALTMLSAVWTTGPPRDALRAGVLILSYAVIVVCAADVARRCGVGPLALVLASLASLEAVVGLGFAALRSLPDAERIGVTWRPGGTFEYSAALALLQVGALPLFVCAAQRRDRLASAGALGAVVAGAVLGCAGSRLALALAAVVLVGAVALGPRRTATLGFAALVLVAGIGAHLILARHAAPGAAGGGAVRLVVMAAMCGVLTAAWIPLRRLAERRPFAARTAVAIAATVAVLAVIGGLLAGAGAGGAATQGGLTHGRVHTFKAAAQTWFDRPVLGAGAGTFYLASARHQGPSPVRFAHDLPLEFAAELGMGGLALGILLYVASGLTLWRARRTDALWLLGPIVVAFLIVNLVDWPWHLAGLSASWALAAGGLVGAGCPGAAGDFTSSARPRRGSAGCR